MTRIFIFFYHQNKTFELYDVYNIWKERGGVLNFTFIGEWQEKMRLNVTLAETKFERRSDLHGMTMKTAFYYVSN